MDPEELKRVLRRRIAKLEKQLEFYRALLELLESGCSAQAATPLEDIHDEDGNLVARLYRLPRGLRLALNTGIPRNSPYLRHLVRKLERLRSETGLEISYELEGDEESIKAITVEGNLTDELLDEVIRLLRFVALRATRRKTA